MTTGKAIYPEGWFPVATARELKTKPLHRISCGIPIVLDRGRDGAVSCLHDRCPHRSAPLSHGRVVDGEIECPYHGWRFNGQGHCTLIPFHDGELPKRFVPSMPVQERHGLIFVRHGEGGSGSLHAILARWIERIAADHSDRRRHEPSERHGTCWNTTHTAFTHKNLMRGLTDSARTLTSVRRPRTAACNWCLLGRKSNKTDGSANLPKAIAPEAQRRFLCRDSWKSCIGMTTRSISSPRFISAQSLKIRRAASLF